MTVDPRLSQGTRRLGGQLRAAPPAGRRAEHRGRAGDPERPGLCRDRQHLVPGSERSENAGLWPSNGEFRGTATRTLHGCSGGPAQATLQPGAHLNQVLCPLTLQHQPGGPEAPRPTSGARWREGAWSCGPLAAWGLGENTGCGPASRDGAGAAACQAGTEARWPSREPGHPPAETGPASLQPSALNRRLWGPGRTGGVPSWRISLPPK